MAGVDDDRLACAPQPGTLFAERYRIERVLGVGGMGFVLAATHIHLHERVAIKMLLPELARSAATVERFLREGRAAVKIRSEHVARVIDVGELPDRTPYLVMEYLDGFDLARILETDRRVPYARAVDWLLEASEAIAEAHAMKTVHRDLKPANLFLTRQRNGTDVIKVLDFGISKMTGIDGADMTMTKTSTLMGSPLYMSPEQLKNLRDVDPRADQWAIGVILYELIHGSPPFIAATLAELGALVLSGSTPQLVEVMPEVPRGLSNIIATCLQKRPADRFVNLADFADAILPYGGPGATASVQNIVQVLGMPSARAVVALHTPVRDSSEIARRRAPAPSAPGASSTDDGYTTASGALGVTTAGITSSTSLDERSGRLRRVIAGGFALLAMVGGVLIYYSTVSSKSAASAMSSGAAPPIVAVASSAPAISTPSPPTSTPSPPTSTPSTAALTAGAKRPPRPGSSRAAVGAASAPPPPPPPPTATATARGIATSSKD